MPKPKPKLDREKYISDDEDYDDAPYFSTTKGYQTIESGSEDENEYGGSGIDDGSIDECYDSDSDDFEVCKNRREFRLFRLNF